MLTGIGAKPEFHSRSFTFEITKWEQQRAEGYLPREFFYKRDAAVNNRYVVTIMSMTGFDYYGASVLAAYIADISRFPSPSRLVSWVGICPSVHQTGESVHMGKMKDGNTNLRRLPH
jgi:transposase